MLTEEQREKNRRRCKIATDNARPVLKPGDRLRVARCGNSSGVTVTMTGWDGDWITSKCLNDIAAINVLKVNGKRVDFLEPLSSTHRPEGS